MVEAGTDVILTHVNSTLDDLINVTASLGDSLLKGAHSGGEHGEEDDDERLSTQMMALLWLGAIAFCVCVKPTIPHPRHRRGAERNRRRRESREKKKVEIDPEQRKKMVDEALIDKKVAFACGKSKMITLEDPSSSSSEEDQPVGQGGAQQNVEEEDDLPSSSDGADASLHDEGEDDENTCMICLEQFCVGENVAFSKHNIGCLHVFHRDCIEQWLMKHDECPCCRSEFIRSAGGQVCAKSDSFSSYGSESDEEMRGDEEELSEERHSMAFVIMNGLISSVRRARYSLVSGDCQSGDIGTSSRVVEDESDAAAGQMTQHNDGVDVESSNPTILGSTFGVDVQDTRPSLCASESSLSLEEILPVEIDLELGS